MEMELKNLSEKVQAEYNFFFKNYDSFEQIGNICLTLPDIKGDTPTKINVDLW